MLDAKRTAELVSRIVAAMEQRREKTAAELLDAKQPTTVLYDRPVAIAGPGTAVRLDRRQIQVSGASVVPQLRMQLVGVGARLDWGEFEELARVFAAETRILERRMPFADLDGPAGVVQRYFGPLVYRYLVSIPDIAESDCDVARSLATELIGIADADHVDTVERVPIDGIEIDEELDVDDCTIRRLSPEERADIWISRGLPSFQPPTPGAEIGLDVGLGRIGPPPAFLLVVRGTRPLAVYDQRPSRARSILLALQVLGFELSGTGLIHSAEQPYWLLGGGVSSRVPMRELPITTKRLTVADLSTATALARKIDSRQLVAPTNGQGVALQRFESARGAAHYDVRLVDHAISLEAALLPGISSELAYRFKLYGTIFLRGHRPPDELWNQFHETYRARSKLVHGSPSDAQVRIAAADLAAELAAAVLRRALYEGWPEPEKLDRLARSWAG